MVYIAARKLPRNLECPLDNVLLDIVDYTNPYFYYVGFTPNGLTLVSAIFGILSCISVFYNLYVYSSILYFIGYFFDCADGNFARRYNMVSKFGDFFDHTKDIVVFVSLVIVLIYKQGVTLWNCMLFLNFLGLLGLNVLYLGELEIQSNKIKSEFLKLFSVRSNISLFYLRHFGCANLNLYVSMVLLHFKFI